MRNNSQDKAKKESDTAHIYEREMQLLQRIKDSQEYSTLSRDEVLKSYFALADEYGKLLKQAIKITRIGDANQRKLFQANEKIQKQKEELSIAYSKLDLIARTDPLTSLSNRRDFLERFQNEVYRFQRNWKSFSLLICDIDDFKTINDQFGHDCGDFILVAIAKLMRTMVRKIDIIARWGGEEFIFLLPESPLTGGEIVAEGIRKRIAEESFYYKDHRINVTVTFGVSEYDGRDDVDWYIKKADEALYSGKSKGKNCVVTVASAIIEG